MKSRTSIVLLTGLVLMISYTDLRISINDTAKVNQDLKIQLEYSQQTQKNTQEQYNALLKDYNIMLNKNKNLQQELHNIKALHIKKTTPSRGQIIDQFTYKTTSRIDIPSGISAEQLNKAFVGTQLNGLGQFFTQAEEEYNINAIFLASIAALESGWGESNFAKKKNNLFGFGSYDYDTKQTIRFNSKGESIIKVAEYLSKEYIDINGKYYNGATPRGINIKYSSSSKWDDKIVSIMNLIVDKVTK